LAYCLAQVGAFAEGSTIGEEAVRMAEAIDHPDSLAGACHGVGVLYLSKGDLHQAMPVLEGSLALCRAWNIWAWFPPLASALGYAYALSGRIAEALPLLEQAVERDAAMKRGPPIRPGSPG